MTIPLPQTPLQSRTASLVEAIANVTAGFVLAVLVQLGAYPLLGITTTMAQNGLLAVLFTVLSLLRSFVVRRMFLALEEGRRRDREQRALSLERRLATGRLSERRPRERHT